MSAEPTLDPVEISIVGFYLSVYTALAFVLTLALAFSRRFKRLIIWSRHFYLKAITISCLLILYLPKVRKIKKSLNFIF